MNPSPFVRLALIDGAAAWVDARRVAYLRSQARAGDGSPRCDVRLEDGTTLYAAEDAEALAARFAGALPT